jgi:hypothetical protein
MMFRSVFASKLAIFKPSLSKPAMALAAALTLGSLPAATDAVAQYGGRDGGGFRDGGFRSDRFRDGEFRGSRFRAPPGFVGRRGPAFRGRYPDGEGRPFARRVFRNGTYQYYYYGCHAWRRAATPWGWRWRRVNICYPFYYE